MNNSAIVTVGIPTYKRPDSLRSCVQSVLSQTYRNIEILVSCNGTDNDTKATVLSFGDKRIKYFEHTKNKGATFNFNFLLSKARGEYFMWLADDDYISPDYILTCVKFMSVNLEFGACYGNVIYPGLTSSPKMEVNMLLDQDDPNERIISYLKYVELNGVFYSFYRNSILKNSVLLNIIGNDWIFVCNILALCKIKHLEGPTITRRFNGIGNFDYYHNLLKNMNYKNHLKVKALFPHFLIIANILHHLNIQNLYPNKNFSQMNFRLEIIRLLISKWLPVMITPKMLAMNILSAMKK